MKNSDLIKTLLIATINEIATDPKKYAANSGRDFTRNRKMGFHDTLLMLFTMEADCIKEEIYRYFGRTTAAPSKAAFYKQRRKRPPLPLPTSSTHLTASWQRSFTTANTCSLPVMGLPLASSVALTPSSLLTASPQETSTKYISMPFIPYSTGGSPTWSSSQGEKEMSTPHAAKWSIIP